MEAIILLPNNMSSSIARQLLLHGYKEKDLYVLLELARKQELVVPIMNTPMVPPIIELISDLWDHNDVRLYLIDQALKVHYDYAISVIAIRLLDLGIKQVIQVIDHLVSTSIHAFNAVFCDLSQDCSCKGSQIILKKHIEQVYGRYINWIQQFSLSIKNYVEYSNSSIYDNYDEYVNCIVKLLDIYKDFMSPNHKEAMKQLKQIINSHDGNIKRLSDAVDAFIAL